MSALINSSQQIERHPEYYISSGDFYLQVESTLFRVHSYFFERDSEDFRAKFSAPIAPNQPRLGSTESHPFIIKNASTAEFSKFLWVFYNRKYSLYSATFSEWLSILKIACEHKFTEVKLLAIRGLDQCRLTDVQKIHVYELYSVDAEHLVPLYAAMCKRDECPTDEETIELGLKTTLLIFRLRESVRSCVGNGSKSPLPSGLDEDSITRTICSALGVKQISSGSPLRRKPPIPTEADFPRRMARRQSMEVTNSRNAVCGDHLFPELGGCRDVAAAAAAEDDVFEKNIGKFKDWKEALKGLDCLQPEKTAYTLIARSDGVSFGVFLVLPVRIILCFVGISWTFVFLLLVGVLPMGCTLVNPFM